MKEWLGVLIFIRTTFSATTLIYELHTSQSANEGIRKWFKQGWIVMNKFSGSTTLESICGNTQLFGGYQVFDKNSYITNFIKLPPHSKMQITFDFWKIDNWATTDYVYINIDGGLIQQAITPTTNSICGDSTICDQMISIDETIIHNFNVAFVEIGASIQATNGFWGINNLKIYIEQCPPGCVICDLEDTTSQQCISWSLSYELLTTLDQVDFNIEGWQIINEDVQTHAQISSCQNIPFLFGNQSQQYSVIRHTITMTTHSEIRILFRFIKQDEFPIIIKIDNKSYFQHLSFISLYCDFTSFFHYQFIYDETISHNSLELVLVFNNSYSFFFFKSFFGLRDLQIFVNIRCDTRYQFECCGDEIKQLGEDCDDGNMIPFDGCHNCLYSCIQGCDFCVLGVCYTCLDGWQYNEQFNLCQLSIEDNQIINYQSNNSLNCDLNCNLCINQICFQCFIGYQLNIIFNQCESICGDGIISYGEDCEIGIINYECNQCKLNQICNNNKCEQCYQGQCYKCKNGYSLENNECISICGDLLVNRDKDEDGNQIEQCDNQDNIGCIDCIILSSYICIGQDYSICLTCEDLCIECVNQNQKLKCNQCIQGYYPKDSNCLPCDFNCITCSHSSQECTSCYRNDCTFCEDNPGLYTDFIGKKCDSLCGDGIFIKYLEQCDDGNLENGDGCSSICEFEYTENIEDESNNYQNAQIIPEISKSQVSTSQNILALQTYLNYALWAIAILLFLTGNRAALWTALEILQEQSYLRYINVEFPQNIVIYFSSSDQISLNPIINYLNLNSIPKLAKFEFVQSDDKLKEYSINANLAYNIQSLILNIVTLFLLTLFLTKIEKYLFTVRYFGKTFFITKQLRRMSLTVQKMLIQIKKSGLSQLLLANFWDCFFMIFLQIKFGNEDNLSNKLLNYLAFLLMIIYSLFILEKLFKFRRLPIQKYWNEKLEAFTIIKKLTFIATIVLFQKDQILQTLFLVIINSFHFIAILQFKIFDNKFQMAKTIFSESVMLIVQITICFYCEDAVIDFDSEKKIYLAWLDIGLLVSIVICHLSLDAIEAIRKVGTLLFKRCQKQPKYKEVQFPFEF